MSNNDVLTGSEIVDICNKYPDARVSFETKITGGFLGGSYTSKTLIRGYKITKDSDNNVIELTFVEDCVIPRL